MGRAHKTFRHVLIEGPDGAGKSTLAAHLLAEHGFARIVAEGPPADEAYVWHGDQNSRGNLNKGYWSLEEYYQRQVINHSAYPTIFDRSLFSELAYAPIMRPGKLGADDEDGIKFAKWFRSQGGLIVLCLPPFETCLGRWRARKQNLPASEYLEGEEQLRRVWEAYQRMRYRTRSLNYFDVDVSASTWQSDKGGFPCQVLCK